MRTLILIAAALVAVGCLTSPASAQVAVYRGPYVTYSPVTAAPVPTVSYYAPVPTTTYYAPTTSYYAPTTTYYAPTTSYVAPAPVPTVSYYAPTPTVTYLPGVYPVRYGVFGMRRAYMPGYVPVVSGW
ncbi:MAG: hypothetical protein K1X74_17490 [Pirellulales bacterium]|nr:hypothetical protein [Pirellulales bacterium]